ncbi:CBS domain-containing protein [Streptomyces sp. NPDC001100]
MSDREAREHAAASAEAQRAVPAFAPAPAEEFRQDMMVRYLQAMASDSHTASTAESALPAEKANGRSTHHHEQAKSIADLQVSHVMRRSVVGISADTPFLDVARMLARRQTGAVPVVDDDQRVIGVITESDLLARAASLAAGDRPGAFDRMLHRRQRPVDAAETAATLMSAPALTVHSWTSVVVAARTAARSRIRQLFVTDHKGRLVGVVSRSELLEALVRDDAAIRAEVVAVVIEGELGIDPARVKVQVLNGVVTLTGTLDAALIPQLRTAVEQIADVVTVSDHLVAV